jgi:hypothetical protein
VAHTVHASQDGLADIFRRMDKFFERLHTYTMISPPQSSTGLNEQIMLTVLSILTIVTEELAQGRTSKFILYMYLVIYFSLIRKILEEVPREKRR